MAKSHYRDNFGRWQQKVTVNITKKLMKEAEDMRINLEQVVADKLKETHKANVEASYYPRARSEQAKAEYNKAKKAEEMEKNKGKYYYFTRYGHKDHTSFDYSNKDEDIYLIFGKESTGIPKEILKSNLDHCMRIPMTDNVRALNVSNSVAIVIDEVLRQQDYNDLLMEEPHKGNDFLERD